MVDVTARARVLGIATQFVNLRTGSILNLPQQVGVLAQMSSAVSYGTTKFQATSATDVAKKLGFGSPAHLIAEQLFPANGDGIGTVPVTFFPLADDPSAVAATGDITPSGTATAAQAWQVSVAGILSLPFVIPAGAVDVTATCAKIYNAIVGVLDMPVIPTFAYGTVTASALVGTGNGTITGLAVHAGSTPIAGVYTLKVKTAVVNGGVWTLLDSTGAIVADNITQTVGASTATVFSNIGGLDFTITDGSTDFALNATFTITVPATKVNVTSKWKGASANGIVLSMSGDSTLGVSWAMTQPSGGLVNPSITAALNQIGSVWQTILLNAMNVDDTATLDLLSTFGEGRWSDLVMKPLVAICGNTAAAEATAAAIPSARPTDRVNAVIPAPGSVNLPFVVAARAVARIASLANNNPPTDYGALKLTGIIPGTDGQQWDYVTKDLALKAGCGSTDVIDGVVTLADVVTFYHPTGEQDPAYRYVVDIVKLQNCLYNLNLPFAAAEWAGAPMVPDIQTVTNPNARQPKHAKGVIAGVIGNLGKAAIISDPATAITTITADISAQNPKGLVWSVTVQLSGNTNVKSATLRFGYFYGNG
jgi:phage tail sheath gpL-like